MGKCSAIMKKYYCLTFLVLIKIGFTYLSAFVNYIYERKGSKLWVLCGCRHKTIALDGEFRVTL